MTESDKKTVVRLLKKGMSPRKISDNTPFPYNFVKAEHDKIKRMENESNA